jgi:large subunit ribosomal protein L21
MYAIIRAGGKQAKVQEGDVLDVERIKSDGEVSFTPLLIVNDDGSVVSDREVLDKLTVTTEVVGDSTGPKIDIFKYKSKTGYRRRAGHRQKYTRLQVTKIEAPVAKKKTAKKKPEAAEKAKKPEAAEKAKKPEAAEKAKKPEAAEKAKKPAKADTTGAKEG